MRECGLNLLQAVAVGVLCLSLPVRECGLKHTQGKDCRHDEIVTPRAGVWIETCMSSSFPLMVKSLPVRECGLKLVIVVDLGNLLLSLPVRECGLKRPRPAYHEPAKAVTPRAGVWIETTYERLLEDVLNSHSPCGSVD